MKKDFDSFMEDVLAELSGQLGEGFHVTRQDTLKNNGAVCRQAVISDGIHAAVPCYCMDWYYEMYRKGEDIRMIAADMAGRCREQGQLEDFGLQWFTDWTKARDRILFWLAGTNRNKEMLAEVPHRDIPHLGLSIVFCAMADAVPGVLASIWVKNSHLDMWGITEDCLFAQAWKNTPVKMKASVESMGTVLYGEKSASGKIPSLYILSNEQKLYGAGCMLYEGVLEQAAEMIGSGFYVLPSSVHEVLLYPSDGKCRKEADALAAMVSEINSSDVLEKKDVLTDEVYYYDKDKQELVIAERVAADAAGADRMTVKSRASD